MRSWASSWTTPPTPRRGFVYDGGKFTVLNPASSFSITNAQSINNNGLVVGFYSLDGVHQHGFTYDSISKATTLLADPIVANLVLTQFLGVNDRNQAVGYYQTTDGSQHGFLYDLNAGKYTFLDDPNSAKSGFSITQITGINDSGEIAGFYVDAATGLARLHRRTGRGPRAGRGGDGGHRPAGRPGRRPPAPGFRVMTRRGDADAISSRDRARPIRAETTGRGSS